jgi:hypothetical protein
MAEDALSKFKGLFGGPKPAPAPPATFSGPPDPGTRHAYEAYEAFENEVRPSSVEIRCHSSGLSYFFDYGQIEVPIFNFRTEREIIFTGCGYAVTIRGRNLRPIMMALRLRVCGTIQEFSEAVCVLPQPIDPKAAFVESISVEVLHGPASKREE